MKQSLIKIFIFSILIFVFVYSEAIACTNLRVLTFAWNQALEDTTSGEFWGWTLYQGQNHGGPYFPTIDIYFNGVKDEYGCQVEICLSDGLFFVMTASEVWENESGYSNEATFPLCEGDFDHDGDVDGSDLATFSADFGRTDCNPMNPCPGDFDHDGDVDGSDLSTFSADYGRVDCPIF